MPDRLCFYSRSADGKAPGKGAGEHVADPRAYRALAGIKGWRKVLSNFHAGAPFEFRGRTYRTIEHAFQAAKIAIADPAKAHLFSLDSGDAIGRGDGGVAQKHRKLVRLDGAQLARWDAVKDAVMAAAAEAKYAACAEARRVLCATGAAELWHIVGRGAPPARFAHLERIRARLCNNNL
jgi:predicted NAD-dependent protein-ADP-ribosyltransferase YbiA (DUF1768 family)